MASNQSRQFTGPRVAELSATDYRVQRMVHARGNVAPLTPAQQHGITRGRVAASLIACPAPTPPTVTIR